MSCHYEKLSIAESISQLATYKSTATRIFLSGSAATLALGLALVLALGGSLVALARAFGWAFGTGTPAF